MFCARFEFDIHRKLVIAHSDRTSQANLYLLDEEGRIVSSSFETGFASYGESLSSLHPSATASIA